MLAIGFSVSLYTVNKANNTQVYNAISLFNIRALSFEEVGSDTGENGNDNEGPCKTVSVPTLEFQDCNGYQKKKRFIYNHKCIGKSRGDCLDGSEYFFYDCDGLEIGHNDFTKITICL